MRHAYFFHQSEDPTALINGVGRHRHWVGVCETPKECDRITTFTCETVRGTIDMKGTAEMTTLTETAEINVFRYGRLRNYGV